ncbi:MAG: SDR family oxidoreductase [Clostridiales bacterium]|nr:SDR family oxidoreductase [Clostridiales bacterium]
MNRKCAIVTGGSSRIGRGTVYLLARNGYDVAFSYRTGEKKAEDVVANLTKECPEGRFFCFRSDMSVRGEGKKFFREACSALGSLDLMVNNAGVCIKEGLLDLTEENTDYMIELDFRNYILMTKEAATYMAAHKIKGSIVNITSTRSERAYPTDGIYGALKAGLNRAIQSFALDVAPYGICINNVAPGAIQRLTADEMEENPVQKPQIAYLSERIPLGRYGQPEDIAKAVLFLASDGAEYITGQTLKVDGGLIIPGMPEWPKDAERGWGKPEVREVSWE